MNSNYILYFFLKKSRHDIINKTGDDYEKTINDSFNFFNDNDLQEIVMLELEEEVALVVAVVLEVQVVEEERPIIIIMIMVMVVERL